MISQQGLSPCSFFCLFLIMTINIYLDKKIIKVFLALERSSKYGKPMESKERRGEEWISLNIVFKI